VKSGKKQEKKRGKTIFNVFASSRRRLFQCQWVGGPSYLRLSVTKIFTHDWTAVAAKSVRPFQQNKAGNGCQDIDNGGHGRCASSVKRDNPGRRTKRDKKSSHTHLRRIPKPGKSFKFTSPTCGSFT